jgi:hypothetical protein
VVAAVAAVAVVVVAAAGAEAAAADAAGNRPEKNTQPHYKWRKLQWCHILIERKGILG